MLDEVDWTAVAVAVPLPEAAPAAEVVLLEAALDFPEAEELALLVAALEAELDAFCN